MLWSPSQTLLTIIFYRPILYLGSAFDYVLESNGALNETLSRFILPTSNQLIVDSDGYQLNVKEIRPPNMDTTGKTTYPVVSLHLDAVLDAAG